MGGGGKGSTSTQSQTVSIPPEVLARYNAVNARAEKTAEQPFQQYGGEFVAPLTPTQTAGIEATSNASQLAQPYYGAATTAALAGAMPVNPQGLQVGQYMNPFTESVVGATQAAMGQQQGQQLAQQQAESIRAGAFGGDRAGLQRQALRGQQGLAQAQAIAPLYQQGYQQALQTAQQQQGVGLGAQQANRQAVQQLSQQLGGLGTGAQQAALQGAQAQIGAGTLQQQTQQAQDTAQYQQFLQQRGYDFQVAQFLANIAMGTGALSGSTTSGAATQPRGFFSNRGGFKTGESLHRAGKAYGGGLDPNSMGGAVYQPGAFERGGYATSGSVVDSTDLAAILAQQRQSFGPFASAGPYGQSAGASPHGPGGIVPQQQLATPKLVTAGPLPKQQAGAGSDLGKVYSLADEATKGLSGKGLTERAGEKMGLRDSPEKNAEAKGANMPGASANATTGSQNPSGGVVPTPAPRDPTATSGSEGLWDQLTGLFKSEGGGIMPRHRYADGGSEDSQADEAVPYDPSDVTSGKDPMEGVLKAGSQKRELLKPSGGGGGGGGGGSKLGLGKLAGSAIGSAFGPLGSMAGGMLGGLLPFNEGGVVPRHGYQTAGAVEDLPIDAEIVERAPGLDPNVVSELKREERRQAPIPQEVKNLASDPTLIRSESGGNWKAENKARGHGGMYGHFGRAQFGHARLQDAMNAGVVPEGTTPEQFMKNPDLQKATEVWHFGDISKFIADKGYDRLIGTKINGIPVTEQGMINAAHLGGKGGLQKYLESGGQYNRNDGRKSLSDYMAMGAGMTGYDRSGQGLGAGRPPADVGRATEAKTAETGFFEKNKGIILPVLQGIGAMASSKSISPWAAALQGLGAGAKAYGDVEAQQAGTAIEKARLPGVMLQSAQQAIMEKGGTIYIYVPKLGYVTRSQWREAGRPPLSVDPALDKIMREAAESYPEPKTGSGAATQTGASTSTVAGTTPAPSTTSAPETPGVYRVKPDSEAQAAAKREISTMEDTNSSNRNLIAAQNLENRKKLESQAKAALDYSQDLNLMNQSLLKLASKDGFLTLGPAADVRYQAVNILNTIARGAGLGDEYTIKGVADKQSAEKAAAIMAGARTQAFGQTANDSLRTILTATPNTKMDPAAVRDLLASLTVAKQKALDEAAYFRNYASISPDVSIGQEAAANYQREYNEKRYMADKKNLVDLMSRKNKQTGETAWEYAMGGGKDPKIREQIIAGLEKKYGDGFRRYLYSTTY